MRKTEPLLVAATILLSACGIVVFQGQAFMGVTVGGIDAPGYAGYQVGDTVQLVATEECGGDIASPNCSHARPSTTNPEDYSWNSPLPDIVEVIWPARAHMVGPGKTTFFVSSKRSNVALPMNVFPRVAAVHASPRSFTIQPGDTVSFSMVAVDANGVAIPGISRGSNTVVVNQDPSSNPVAVPIGGDSTRYLYLAKHVGTQVLIVRLLFYKPPPPDTVTIVVVQPPQ